MRHKDPHQSTRFTSLSPQDCYPQKSTSRHIMLLARCISRMDNAAAAFPACITGARVWQPHPPGPAAATEANPITPKTSICCSRTMPRMACTQAATAHHLQKLVCFRGTRKQVVHTRKTTKCPPKRTTVHGPQGTADNPLTLVERPKFMSQLHSAKSPST